MNKCECIEGEQLFRNEVNIENLTEMVVHYIIGDSSTTPEVHGNNVRTVLNVEIT